MTLKFGFLLIAVYVLLGGALIACTKGTPDISSISSLKSGLEIPAESLKDSRLCLASAQSKTISLRCNDLRIVEIKYAISQSSPSEWLLAKDTQGNQVNCASGEAQITIAPQISTTGKNLYIKAQTENAEVASVHYPLIDSQTTALSLAASGSLAISSGGQVQLQVVGGEEPYNFEVTNGVGTVDGKGLFTAPVVSENINSNIVVKDSACADPLEVPVQIIGNFGLVISGQPQPLMKDSQVNISVSLYGSNMQVLSGRYKYQLVVNQECTELALQNATPRSSATIISESLLQDGNYQLCAIGEKPDGTWQSFAELSKVSWVRDTTPPTLTLSSPAAGSFVNQQNVTSVSFSGTCSESGRIVGVSIGSLQQEDVLCVDGSWSLLRDVSSLPDGDIQVSLAQADTIGNQSTIGPIVIKKDVVAPSAPSSVVDGLYGSSLTTSPVVTFVQGSDASGIAKTEAQVLKSGDLSLISDWKTITSNSAISALSLFEGQSYKVRLRSQDNAGNFSTQALSDGWLVDTVAPILSATFIDGSQTTVLTESPTMNWGAATETGSGIGNYQIAIGTTLGSTDILAFTNVGTGLTKKITTLSLNDFTTYYSSLRVIDKAGNQSVVKTGDGWVTKVNVCDGIPVGGACIGGAINAGAFDGKNYMVTVSGCDNSATPTCSGAVDTVKFGYTEGPATAAISEVASVSASSAIVPEVFGQYSQYGGFPTNYMTAYGGPEYGGYQLASNYCHSLVHGGFDDWFLPNKSEQAYLYCNAVSGSHTASYPQEAPNCTIFGGKKHLITGYAAGAYWAATQVNATNSWLVNFNSGNQTSSLKANLFYVRCARRY